MRWGTGEPQKAKGFTVLLILGSSSESNLPMTSAQPSLSKAWPLLSMSIYFTPVDTYTLLSQWHLKLKKTETEFFICCTDLLTLPCLLSWALTLPSTQSGESLKSFFDSSFHFPCPTIHSSLQISLWFSPLSPSLPPLPWLRPSPFCSWTISRNNQFDFNLFQFYSNLFNHI